MAPPPTPPSGPSSPSPDSPTARVRERVLAEHREVVATVLDCADAVAAELSEPVTDGRALAGALDDALADAGAIERLPTVLSTAVDALDAPLAAEPVAAPPYVVVTSRGPMYRATTDRGRLVVLVRAFAVETASDQSDSTSLPSHYVRDARSVGDALTVTLR